MHLQLGDIIQIDAPSNTDLNGLTFFIDYIDARKIKIINTDNLQEHVLRIDAASGRLADESIILISILSHPEAAGYARQNDLVPNTWVDVYFGGDLPVTITGLITDLEEDMIEIKTFPDDEIIYIDFEYKGIPEKIPIDRITIRAPPAEVAGKDTLDSQGQIRSQTQTAQTTEEATEEATEEVVTQPAGVSDATLTAAATAAFVPSEELRQKLRDMLYTADEIVFGEELDVLIQTVEVSEDRQRFTLEHQLNDLMDILLSNVPNNQRSRSVMANLHAMVERFKHLRNEYSEFNAADGAPRIPEPHGPNHKPLVNKLEKMQGALTWLLPVVKNTRHLYTGGDNPEYDTIVDDARIRNVDKAFDTEPGSTDWLPAFSAPQSVDDVLIEKRVEDNITAVIDNLGDFYSSTPASRRRFVIQKYNLALTKLQVLRSSGMKNITRMSAVAVPMTDADKIAVKSVLVLPEEAATFSRISLPGTSILDRSHLNLHHFNYWELLRQNRRVERKEVLDLNKELDYNSRDFLNTVKEYIYTGGDEMDDAAKGARYRKFLTAVIPRTRVLFDMIKKHLRGEITLTAVMAQLEPFMVYHRDISAKQYEDVTSFLFERVMEYKRAYATKSRQFRKLMLAAYQPAVTGLSLIYKLIVTGKMVDLNVFEKYGFSTDEITSSDKGSSNNSNRLLSTSEVIERMMGVDFGKLYIDAVAISNADLVVHADVISTVLDEEIQKAETDVAEGTHRRGKARNYVLAKKYDSMDEMLEANDRGIPVYFDREFDRTQYDVLDKLEKEKLSMSEENFHSYLIDYVIRHDKVGIEQAEIEADAMLLGMRVVRDGNYAVVLEYDGGSGVSGSMDEPTYLYFKYSQSKKAWIRDEDIPATKDYEHSRNLFCNLNKDCVELAVNGSGVTEGTDAGIAADILRRNVLTQIKDEFDVKYEFTRDNYMKMLHEKYNYDMTRAVKLRDILRRAAFKYNDHKFRIGAGVAEEEEEGNVVVSPHAYKRDMILSQDDYVTRQHDIIQFVTMYTRKANALMNEDVHWLYCTESNVKLLPSFMEDVAKAFISGNDYMMVLDGICKARGAISDDGESWVDKYSGYVIKRIEHSTEEGFDEAGYALHTREVMEAELGDIVAKKLLEEEAAAAQKARTKKYESPNARIVANVVTTMAGYIGVDLSHQRDFIIEHTLSTLEMNMPKEADYNAILEKKLSEGKKMETYKTVYFRTLLLLTLAYIVVAIQINIPSLRTRKTHPGCKRSFSGMPLDGSEDITGIAYVACIAFKLKSGIEPWNTLTRPKIKSETDVADNIKTIMINYIVPNAVIQEKLHAKREHLARASADDFIPSALTVNRWINFLPPISDSNMPVPHPLSSDFKQTLKDDFKHGYAGQRDKLCALESRILHYSIALTDLINGVVKQHDPLMWANSTSVPFVENACCNEPLDARHVKTLDYFIAADKNVQNYNELIGHMSRMVSELLPCPRPMFLSNYENIVKSISGGLAAMARKMGDSLDNESLIYQAFTVLCRFNNDIPISEEMTALCMGKPAAAEYSASDPLSEKIRKLKATQRIYTKDTLDRLLQAVNRANQLPGKLIALDKDKEGGVRARHGQWSDVLSHFADKDKAFAETGDADVRCRIPEELRRLLLENVESGDVGGVHEDTEEMRNLKNYLARTNDALIDNIMGFLSEYMRTTRNKLTAIRAFLATLMDFNETGNNVLMSKNDETLAKAALFIQNTMQRLTDVFPYIILNKVDFNEDNIMNSRHWKLSSGHFHDIRKIISSHYSALRQFYRDDVIESVLRRALDEVDDLKRLISATPFYAETFYDDFTEASEMAAKVRESNRNSSNSSNTSGSGIEMPDSVEIAFERAKAANRKKPEYLQHTYSTFDRRIVRQLHHYYFLSLLNIYVQMVRQTPVSIYQSEPTELVMKKKPGSSATIEKTVTTSMTTTIFSPVDELDIVMGNKKALGQRVAELLATFIQIIETDKKAVNFNARNIREDITRIKDKEKDELLKYLDNMTAGEREIEKLFKAHKLGRWNLGMQKGVWKYSMDVYDTERKEMQLLAKAEKRAGKHDVVTGMNYDVFLDEAMEQIMSEDQIEEEVNDISWLPVDDDAENDDDYMLPNDGDGERGNPLEEYGWDDNAPGDWNILAAE